MSESAAVRYELLYIIPTSFTEDEAGTIEQKVSALISKYGGTVEDMTRLGKLRMAYEIKNQRHGFYVLSHFSADRESLAKIDENLRITSELLRHLILRADEAGDAKFELVEFKEINLDNKEDKPRRRETPKEEAPKEEKKEESKDIDTKIEQALSEDNKGV